MSNFKFLASTSDKGQMILYIDDYSGTLYLCIAVSVIPAKQFFLRDFLKCTNSNSGATWLQTEVFVIVTGV